MQRSRKTLLLSVLALLLLLVAACGGTGAEPTATTAPDSDGGEAEQPAEPTEAPADTGGEDTQLELIGWSSSDAENELLNEIIADLNESQDTYTASFSPAPNYDEFLQAALAGGEPPDVFYLDSFKFPDFHDQGVLMNLDIENPDDFYESLRDGFSADGEFYCPPKDFSTLGLIYNETMFEEAGLDVPTTWDELQSAAEQLTNEDEGVYGLSLSADAARFLAFLYQAGGEVLADDGTMNFNTPEAKQAFEYYTGLLQDGYAVTPDQVDSGWNGEAFGKQAVAMTVEGNWMVPFLERDYPDVNFGVAELPEGPGGKATLAFTVCYAVPQSAPNPEASQAFVNDLTSEEGMQEWTDLGLAMPTRKSLRDHWVEQFPDRQAFLAGAEYAHPWQFVPGFQAVIDEINNGIQQINAGQATVDQTLESVQQAGEDVVGQ